MPSRTEKIIKETPTNAKVVLASTFAKSFNSMPKWLRWGTVIAIILGTFYFTIIRSYIKDYKEKSQIEVVQSSIDDLSIKLKIIEANQMNSLEIYEEVEEIHEIFNVFAEAERKKVKAFINFLRNTHGRKFDKDRYERAINQFEIEDYKLQKEYQDKVEIVFSERLNKRLNKMNRNKDGPDSQ